MAQVDISAWIPEVWAQEALAHLKPRMNLVRLLNRNYSNEVSARGRVVNVPIPPTLAATTKVKGTPVTPQSDTASTIPVALDQHVISAYEVDDIEHIQSQPDEIASYGKAAAIAISKHVEQHVLQEWVNAAGGNTIGTAGTPLTRANILDLRQGLNAKDAPMEERFAFIDNASSRSFLEELSTSAASALNNDPSSLRQGAIGNLYGIDIYETQLNEVVSGTPDATHGLGFHRDAMTFVTRGLSNTPSGLGVATYSVTDPDVGITLRVQMNYDNLNKAHVVTYDVLYGVKTVRPDFLYDLVA